MANWKTLFGDKVCKCGSKKELHVVSNGSGKVAGYVCVECRKGADQ